MTTLLLLLFLHGLFLAVLLALYGKSRQPANRVLSALVLTISALLFDAYLYSSGAVERWPHLLGLLAPGWLLIGPLTLLYVRRVLEKPSRPQDLLLGLPALAATALMVPFYFQPAAAKLAAPQHMGSLAGAVVNHTLFWILTGWCAYRSWRAIRSDRAADHAALPPWRRGWLRWLMAILILYTVLDLAAAGFLVAAGRSPSILSVVSLLALTSIIYAVGLLVVAPDGVLARAPWPGKRQERSPISESRAQREIATLERLMNEEKVWLDESLRLTDLARLVGVTRHHLSQLLSQHVGLSSPDT
jgi:hypothetical protein